MQTLDDQNYNKKRMLPCPNCGGKEITRIRLTDVNAHRCWGCGHKWQTSTNEERKKRKMGG